MSYIVGGTFIWGYCVFADQEERQWAIREFKEGRKDVLVATDIAGKGLDFPNIQHVINYDMPADIENYGMCLHAYPLAVWIEGRKYAIMIFWCLRTRKMLYLYTVHRIGRTGRCGKTGIATTFVNKLCGKCKAKSNTVLVRLLSGQPPSIFIYPPLHMNTVKLHALWQTRGNQLWLCCHATIFGRIAVVQS